MTDRFKDYNAEVKELVLDFEEMQRRGERHYFDVDQLSIIIDYYIETYDYEQFQNAVIFAESLYPNANPIRLRRSHLLCSREKFKESLVILQDLERQEPDNTDVMYALGAVYSALNNPRKSIRYFQKAATDGRELNAVYGNIGDEYARLGEDREAIGYYKRALKANPKDERVIYNLFETFESAEMNLQGITFFDAFVGDNPFSVPAWYCLGMLYKEENLYERAVDAFEYVIAIDPTFKDAYLQKTDILNEMGDTKGAVQSLHEAMPYVDDQAALNGAIGACYMEGKNYETALIYFRKAAEMDPSSGRVMMAIAGCYAQLGDNFNALDYIERSFKESPDEPSLLFDAASIYKRFDKIDLATECYEKGLELNPFNDRAWIDYADMMIGIDDYRTAAEILERGLVNCEEPLCFNQRLAVCCFITNQRNLMFNAIRAVAIEDINSLDTILRVCPTMREDIEVMDLISSYLK